MRVTLGGFCGVTGQKSSEVPGQVQRVRKGADDGSVLEPSGTFSASNPTETTESNPH